MALLPNGFRALEKGMTQAQRREVINHNFALCVRLIKGDGENIFVDQQPGVTNIRLGDTENESGGGGGGGVPPPDAMPICDGGDAIVLGQVGEGAEAADDETFLHDAENGLIIYVMTRVYYDHAASPPVLYGYQRPLSFDKNGRLCQVGAEEQYTIDDPAEC